MWILFELDDTNMTFTLYDDANAIIAGPHTYTAALYSYNMADKPEEFIVIRKFEDENRIGSWPPVAMFPKQNMVFLNSSTGPVEPLPAV